MRSNLAVQQMPQPQNNSNQVNAFIGLEDTNQSPSNRIQQRVQGVTVSSEVDQRKFETNEAFVKRFLKDNKINGFTGPSKSGPDFVLITVANPQIAQRLNALLKEKEMGDPNIPTMELSGPVERGAQGCEPLPNKKLKGYGH